jgi:hypothetical protein
LTGLRAASKNGGKLFGVVLEGQESAADTGVEMNLLQAHGACTFGAPVFQSDEVLKWNPFRDRIILTIAAIFFEGVESYRAITSSTGVESFFDLLIVNGSDNLRKWKLLGSIDEIMNDFHKHHKEGSRIPAVFEPHDVGGFVIRCSKIDDKSTLNRVAQNSSGASDFSLHGPAVSSKDSIQLTGSNDAFHQSIVVDTLKKSFSEKLEWFPFQPGCIFQMRWSSLQNEVGTTFSMADSENSITVSGDTRSVPAITVKFVEGKLDEPNCHLHSHCFQALQTKVEEITTGDSDGRADASSRILYAHQYLDAYKPKGKAALISPFFHSIISLAAVIPTLAFFVLLGWSQITSVSLVIYFLIFAF